ncbi:general transcription factor 3C polypeptide 1 isoform X3 [Lethenteron reissneri]|uniref:general transcription factor 3C polypeptide 1 isoform X3 n=1 Tax=Lethenteron reissneri TaxID=7753 RepID=UPI002AB63066|nr:general transcription factor 3C polypeptide 1 isoform X3 [Lethenteron reissneri]
MDLTLSSMDALEALADEVALEGLDGVTPSALWVRLAARSPPFPGGGAPRRDVALRAFLWAALASHPGVDFYELPVPRPPLLLRETAAVEVDAARDEGCKDEAEAPSGRWESSPDIYPVHMLLDDPAGMQGSCRYYGERTWGDTLVAVASQELRWRALAGWQCDPDLRVPDFSYCLLERLGRARWEGALQSDLHTNVFHIDARKMHYHRGFLDRLGLVTLQSHVTRRPNGSQMHSMLLLLKRFHIDRAGCRHSKYSVLMQKLSDKLMMRPTRTDSIARLRTEMSMDGRSFRKLYQFMVTLGHIVITSVVKQTQQGRPCKNTRGNDVMVRSLQLVRAFGEAEAEAEVEKEETPIQRPVRPQGLVLQRDMLTQALDLVRRHGTGGISHSELCLELNVGKLEGRMLCRTLCRRGLVKDIMEDEGRQRTTKYIAQQFVKTSVLSQQIERERARNQELTTPGGAGPSPAAPAWAVAQPGRTHGRVKRCGAGAAPRRPDTVFPWNWGAAGRWRQPGKSAAGAATSGVATAQDPAALLPSKRGRPKGSKNKKSSLKKNKKAKVNTKASGRKRGRPRKHPLPQADETTAEDKPGHAAADESEVKVMAEQLQEATAVAAATAELVLAPATESTDPADAPHAGPGTEVEAASAPSETGTRGEGGDEQEPAPEGGAVACRESVALLDAGEAAARREGEAPLGAAAGQAGAPADSEGPAPEGHGVCKVEVDEEAEVKPEGGELLLEPAAPHKPGATRGPTRLTYRLLKRQNMIIEAVRSHRLIESLFALQKMIVDEERVEGVSGRCCRKSIVRLVNKLADDGQLRLYRTTVVQDGITKKVELVVHPSVSPHDPLVKSALEQVRFRISGSYSSQRAKASAQAHKAQAEGAAAAAAAAAAADETSPGGTKKTGERRDSHDEAGESSGDSRGGRVSATGQKATRTLGLQRTIDIRMGITPLLDYSPPIVPGLGRSLGFMPKMPRLRILHTFLWYIVHGHKLKQEPPAALPRGGAEAPDGEGSSLAETSGDGAGPPAAENSKDPGTLSEVASEVAPRWEGDQSEGRPSVGTGQSSTSPSSQAEQLFAEETVYMEVQDWRRFTPPAPIHGEYGEGWALVSDILLCMPLSVFVQLIRISYRVDGLQELLDDPVKKHTLVRFLPVAMRQQLLFKRRYIFLIFECFQRLWFMGLLHFGPLERFQDKDQVFVYLKRRATVVDTTTCEPHYKLAQSSEPFERRTYSLRAMENVDEYWLHMQCVCLNTPLGVVRNQQRSKSGGADGEETEQGSYDDKLLNKKCSMLEYTSGSREVQDDGTIPGDGLGAGGLDSCFFGHLKRNWIWMSYILQKDKPDLGRGSGTSTVRLQTLLQKPLHGSHPMGRFGDGASVGAAAAAATTTRGGDDGWPVARTDDVLLRKVEAANRNKAVAGGKGQKRKRDKRDAEPRKASPKRKKPKKPNESPRKRREEGSPKMYYDETDRSALSRMTKQRVAWTEQEDGLLLLCRVACTILNAKVRRPFVPWQVIRDVLHAEYVSSLDKTSHAVARRSRYILKNSRTDLNYRICLAEATQDSKLVEEIMNQTGDYANPQVCALEFTEFVQRLRAKFRPNPETLQMDIPDSLEELFRKYRVMTVWKESGKKARPEANSLDDIHAMVLENFIQSTLALSDRQVKNNLAYQIFRIYQYYSEQVLLSTFQRYTQRGLVNRRRISKQIGPKKSRALPFAPMSYQLSQGYYRFFTWRYLSSLLTEAHRFMRTLRDAGAEDKPNVVLFRGREPAVTAAPAETPAGSTVRAPAEAPAGSTMGAMLEPPAEALAEATVGGATCGSAASMTGAGGVGGGTSAAVTYTMDAPGGACACVLALMAMGWLACELEIPEQIVVVDSTMVDSAVLKALAHENSDDDDDDEEDNEEDDDESGRHGAGGVGGRQRVDVNPRQSSRVRYLLMKGYYVPGIVGVRNLNPNDNIVVNSCTVRFRLLPSPRPYGLPSRYDALDTAEGVELLPPWFSVVMDGEEPSQSESALYDHDEVDVPAVLDVIRAAGVAGVDMAQLTAAFPHMAQRSEVGGPTRWHGLLQTLEKQGAVLQVGYTSRRVVTPEHAHAWLVRCSRTDDYMESGGVGTAAAGQNAEDAGAGAELSTIEKAAVTSTTAGAGPGSRSRPGSPDRSPNRPECKEVIVTNGNMNGGAATELETQKAVAIDASADDGDDGNDGDKEWRVKGCAVEVVTSTADMAKGCQKRALTTDDNDGDNAVGGDADESVRSAVTKRARVDIADVCNGGGARDLEMTAQQETCAGPKETCTVGDEAVNGSRDTGTVRRETYTGSRETCTVGAEISTGPTQTCTVGTETCDGSKEISTGPTPTCTVGTEISTGPTQTCTAGTETCDGSKEISTVGTETCGGSMEISTGPTQTCTVGTEISTGPTQTCTVGTETCGGSKETCTGPTPTCTVGTETCDDGSIEISTGSTPTCTVGTETCARNPSSVKQDASSASGAEGTGSSVRDGTWDTQGLPAHRTTGERSAVRFAARPWRGVQGDLNTPVCKGMLEALLLHVMSQPGLPEHRLLRHYAGVLQPQVLRELLMVLEELGCVRRLRLPRRSKVTAFSSPWRRDEVPSPQGEPLNGGNDDDDDGCSLFLEPTVDGILRLGRLLPDEVNWNHCAAMTQS